MMAKIVDGIIPARAGFTLLNVPVSGSWADHPRSRGVYWLAVADAVGAPGSSPLARGLLLVRELLPRLVRIIPARAGFTRAPGAGPVDSPDHPRSRGVYGWHRDYGRRLAGSSPLARGLRERAPEVLVDLGIIPARAGFTVGMH